MNKITVLLGFLLLSALGFLACDNGVGTKAGAATGENGKEGKKDNKDKEADDNEDAADVRVLQSWDMPDILTEISDIENIDNRSFACIQDESGTIYIYNLELNKIVKEIPFAGKGDYEGITMVGNAAYVVNSSGVIYEVNDISLDKPVVATFKTFLTVKDDVEAICYDKQNNRLLLAYKAEEDNGKKGVYAFDLKNKSLEKNPVYVIATDIEAGSEKKGKKKKQGIKPSAIAIHPVNGDIYLLEGTNPKLLIADKEGKMKSLTILNNKIFEQPEGITFNASGDLFISNEGKKGKGNILKVQL